MKIFKNKNIVNLIKLIIYVELLTISYYLEWNVEFLKENRTALFFNKIVQWIFIVLIGWTVIKFIILNYKLIFAKVKKILENIKKYIKKKLADAKKMFQNVFKFIKKVIQFKYNKKKYIKGKDEKQFIFNFDLIEKFKNRRRKLDLKHSKSNMEMIRLLYIKLILILTAKDKEVKYSYTPKEVRKNCGDNKSDILFETYEQVRYGEVFVTDEVVQLCEKTME